MENSLLLNALLTTKSVIFFFDFLSLEYPPYSKSCFDVWKYDWIHEQTNCIIVINININYCDRTKFLLYTWF